MGTVSFVEGTRSSRFQDEAFAYTGRFFDKDTGLQNDLNRWYDPATGRFTSQDPKSFAAGDANLYRCVWNSPTNFKDRTGLGADHIQGRVQDLTTWQKWKLYFHYLNPFVHHHQVDRTDTALDVGAKVGAGVAVVGWGGAAAVTAAGVGDTVIIGGRVGPVVFEEVKEGSVPLLDNETGEEVGRMGRSHPWIRGNGTELPPSEPPTGSGIPGPPGHPPSTWPSMN